MVRKAEHLLLQSPELLPPGHTGRHPYPWDLYMPKICSGGATNPQETTVTSRPGGGSVGGEMLQVQEPLIRTSLFTEEDGRADCLRDTRRQVHFLTREPLLTICSPGRVGVQAQHSLWFRGDWASWVGPEGKGVWRKRLHSSGSVGDAGNQSCRIRSVRDSPGSDQH